MIHHVAIAVAVLLVLVVLVCTGLYFSYSKRRAFISTTEWVKLMRENDLQFNRAARAAKSARTAKSHPPKPGDLLLPAILL